MDWLVICLVIFIVFQKVQMVNYWSHYSAKTFKTCYFSDLSMESSTYLGHKYLIFLRVFNPCQIPVYEYFNCFSSQNDYLRQMFCVCQICRELFSYYIICGMLLFLLLFLGKWLLKKHLQRNFTGAVLIENFCSAILQLLTFKMEQFNYA